MSSAPSAASQFCRHILVKLILLDFIHVVGFFLFVLKLHQLHKDGVNNARINLRDISGGRVYLMCLLGSLVSGKSVLPARSSTA